MPDYRRYYVAEATVFFTLVTHERRPFLTDRLARRCLRLALHKVMAQRPFAAIVLLPDHLHALWTLPPGDSDFSIRWRRIKEEFTCAFLRCGGKEGRRSSSRRRRKERGVWQRRFYDHVIRDERDFERHFDYVHYNPVKHGLVRRPRDWPYSSFHRWVKLDHYPLEWGCGPEPVQFAGLDEDAME